MKNFSKLQRVKQLSVFIPLLLITGVIGFASNVVHATTALPSGYLTSTQELAVIRQQVQNQQEPYYSIASEFLDESISAPDWQYGQAGTQYIAVGSSCAQAGTSVDDLFIDQQGGAQGVYQKMLAYHLTLDDTYAQVAHNKILDLTRTTYFGGDVYNGDNECILQLARSAPLWIQSASLLEGHPLWSIEDRRLFQDWLIREVYHKVAWASLGKRNNWGAAGSLAASMIADYVRDRDVVLQEIEPASRILTPQQAYQVHNAQQLLRMNTTWESSSRCNIYGIQRYGGIPDELRRGSTGCDGQYLADNDSSYEYQIMQIDILMFHAEYLRHRGDMSIYNNVAEDGSGSLLRAILFIIYNPANNAASYNWQRYKIGTLAVAYQHYQHPMIEEQLLTRGTNLYRGGIVSYGQVTHPLGGTNNLLVQPTTMPDDPETAPVQPTTMPDDPETAPVQPTATPVIVQPTATPVIVQPTSAPVIVQPTATAMPSNARLSAPAQPQLHVADMDASVNRDGSQWIAFVTVLVHNENEQPVQGASVRLRWSLDGTETTCTTQSNGTCILQSSSIHNRNQQVNASIVSLQYSNIPYMAGQNHDPDGDSNGSTITVNRN